MPKTEDEQDIQDGKANSKPNYGFEIETTAYHFPDTNGKRVCKVCQQAKFVLEFPKFKRMFVCSKCFNRRHKRGAHMPARARYLNNLINQCRKDNHRFFHKRFGVRESELRRCVEDSGRNDDTLRHGRLVPLCVHDEEITSSNCVILDRQLASVAIAGYRAAQSKSDPKVFEKILRVVISDRD